MHFSGSHDSRVSVSVILVGKHPCSVLVLANPGGLRESLLRRLLLRLRLLNLLLQLRDLVHELVDELSALVHGAGLVDGQARVVSPILLAGLLPLKIEVLLILEERNHVVNGLNDLREVAASLAVQACREDAEAAVL